MPRIPGSTDFGGVNPRVASDPGVDTRGLTTAMAGPAASLATGAAQVADVATSLNDRIRRTDTAAEIAKGKADGLVKREEILSGFEGDTDYGTQEARYREQIGKTHAEILAGTRNEAAKQALQNDFKVDAERGAIAIRTAARRGLVDQSITNATAATETLANASGRLTDPEQIAENDVHVKLLWDGLVSTGAVKPQVAEAQVRKYLTTVAERQFHYMLDKDPVAAKEALDTGLWDNRLDEDRRHALRNEAETGIRRIEAEARAAENEKRMEARASAHLYYDDAMAEINATGKTSLPIEGFIRAGYSNNPEVAADMIAKLNKAREYYPVRQAVSLTSPAEDDAALARLQSGIKGTGAAQTAQQLADYARAVSDKRRALDADPFAYVAAAAPTVAEKLGKPETFKQGLLEADQAQANLGVPEWRRSFMGKGQASAVAAKLNAADPETVADELASLSAQYGDKFGNVRRELQAQHLNPALWPVARLSGPADVATRRDLVIAVKSGKELEKALPKGAEGKISEAINHLYSGLGKSVTFNGPAAQDSVASEIAAAKSLAILYTAQRGMDPEKAAKLAHEQLIGSKYDFVDQSAGADFESTYRVPKGMARQVEEWAQTKLDALKPEDFAPAQGGERALSDPYRRNAALDFARRGVWVNTPDGKGLKLMRPDGFPVELMGGKPVVLMFDEALAKEAPLPNRAEAVAPKANPKAGSTRGMGVGIAP